MNRLRLRIILSNAHIHASANNGKALCNFDAGYIIYV